MAFAILVNIVLVPYYLKFFSLEMYGAWIATGGIIGMLGLLDGGINLTLTQKLCNATARGDGDEFSKYFIAGGVITTLLTLFIPLVCWILSPYVGNAVNFHGPDLKDLQSAFLVAGIATFCSLGTSTISTAFQAWGLVHHSGLVSIATLCIGVAATLLGLHWDMGIIAIPFGTAARSFTGLLALLIMLIVQWRLQRIPVLFSRAAAREMISISAHVSGGRIFESVAANSENLIVANLIDPKAVAIWTISTRAITMAGVFLNPIGSSLFTSMAGFMAKSDTAESWIMVKSVIRNIASIAAVFFGVSVAMNAFFVSIWVGPANYLSHHIDILAAFAIMLTQRSSLLSLIATAYGKPKLAVNIMVLGGILSTGILYLSAKQLGVAAIPLSRIIVHLIFILPFFIFAYHKLFQQQLIPVGLEFISSFLPTLVAVSLAMCFSFFIPISHDWINFIAYSLLTLLALVILLLALFPNNRTVLHHLCKNTLNTFSKKSS